MPDGAVRHWYDVVGGNLDDSERFARQYLADVVDTARRKAADNPDDPDLQRDADQAEQTAKDPSGLERFRS